MTTDKQVYLIFRTLPEMVYVLAGLPNPGVCHMESVSFKDIERTTDGLIVPDDESRPMCLFEVQFQLSATIYTRMAVSMALAQEPHLPREIQGVVFFARRAMDPATPPWPRIVHAVYLEEELLRLARNEPGHPLVAVFAPVFVEDESELEAAAAGYYHQLETASLTEAQRDTLMRVFFDWLMERLQTKSREEIAMILNLSDVRESRAAKELLDEGRKEGLQEGVLNALLVFGSRHFGACPAALETRIRGLDLGAKEALFSAMMDMGGWQDVSAWLDAQ